MPRCGRSLPSSPPPGEAALPATDETGGFAGVLASADVMDALVADEDLRTRPSSAKTAWLPEQPISDALRLLDAGARRSRGHRRTTTPSWGG